jgi:hypothetical protein
MKILPKIPRIRLQGTNKAWSILLASWLREEDAGPISIPSDAQALAGCLARGGVLGRQNLRDATQLSRDLRKRRWDMTITYF